MNKIFIYRGNENDNKKAADKIKISKDIQEITDVLNNPCGFDREKAEEIIKKHNTSNAKVAVMNSPLSPNYVRFEHATNDMVANNLVGILNILKLELVQEIKNDTKQSK